jgi:hypothetical protein
MQRRAGMAQQIVRRIAAALVAALAEGDADAGGRKDLVLIGQGS